MRPTWSDVRQFCLAQGYVAHRIDPVRYVKLLPDKQTSGTAVSLARVTQTVPSQMWRLVWQQQLRLASEAEFWKGLGGEPVQYNIPPHLRHPRTERLSTESGEEELQP